MINEIIVGSATNHQYCIYKPPSLCMMLVSQEMMHKNIQMVIYKYIAQGVKQQELGQQNTMCCA
jgi:hypothetical protein